MKRLPIALACVLLLTAAPAALASGSNALATARRTLADGVSRGDAATLLEARSAFGAAAAADPEDAVARYWVAVASWRVTPLLQSKDKARARQVCESGLAACTRALELRAGFADALAIQASLQGLWLAFEPSQTMTIGPAMEETMARAARLEPKNPRVALLRGILTLHKPAFVGGGPERAKPEFDRAIELYDSGAGKEDALAWGRADASLWAGRCAMQRNDAASAKRHFERALELDPGNTWVKRSLLPEAEKALAGAAAPDSAARPRP